MKKDELSFLGRYEFSTEKRTKFWEIKKDGPKSFLVSWGIIGKKEESVNWDASYSFVISQLRSKANQKLKKGYKKVK